MLIKAQVKVDPTLDADFAQALREITSDVDAVLLETAQEVGFAARRSTAFLDYKGTARESNRSKKKRSQAAKRLRHSIEVRKSQFEGGGYIVAATAPHAHLVEFGHAKVVKDKNGVVKVIGQVTAHPFLRPALDSAKRSILAKLRSKQNG